MVTVALAGLLIVNLSLLTGVVAVVIVDDDVVVVVVAAAVVVMLSGAIFFPFTEAACA